MNRPAQRYRSACAAALAIALLPATGLAASAEQRYRDDRAACLQRPVTARDACLREAAAAREAARRGQLSTGAAYEANRTLRCQALPEAEREACVRRARGEGTVSGSVESGGMLREYREIILPPVPPQESVAAPTQEQTGTIPAPAPVQAAPPAVTAPHPAPAGVMLQRPQ